jgi:hypothetical protein
MAHTTTGRDSPSSLRTAQMKDCRPASDQNVALGNSGNGEYLEAELILGRQLFVESIRFALIK